MHPGPRRGARPCMRSLAVTSATALPLPLPRMRTARGRDHPGLSAHRYFPGTSPRGHLPHPRSPAQGASMRFCTAATPRSSYASRSSLLCAPWVPQACASACMCAVSLLAVAYMMDSCRWLVGQGGGGLFREGQWGLVTRQYSTTVQHDSTATVQHDSTA